MQKTYFKLGDPDFNSSNDEYKEFEIGSTNGVNLAINMGGAIISNNATPEDPNPTEKSILVNGEPISGGGGSHIIEVQVQTNADTGDNYLDTNITYDDISTMLSDGIIPTLHINVDLEGDPVASVDYVNVFNNTYAQFSGTYYDVDAETGETREIETYSFSLVWPAGSTADHFSVQRFTISAPEPGVPSVHVAEYSI